MISEQKIALVGTVSPSGLGDALQCYVGIKLLSNLFSKANITFVCPDLEEEISVFRNLKLNAHLSSVGLTGAKLFKSLLLSAIPQNRASKADGRTTTEIQFDTFRKVLENIQILGKRFCNSYVFGKYVGQSIARSLFSFNAGIFGGHTICTNVNEFIVQYETLRSVVRGPILTFPISLSKLPFEHYGHKTWKRLKRSLQKMDFVYVRGSHSLEILRDNLNIDENRVAMALDSGFGMRLIRPDIIASKVSKKQPLRIIIIPRKDYFYKYNRWSLYEPYLAAIIGFIEWLSRNCDAKVYLTTQTTGYDPMGDQSAIDDLVWLLEKRAVNSRCLKRLMIVESNSIIDAYKLCASADLVVTSRMHGGIMALSSDTPVVFIIPSLDVKILDNLSFLGLDTNRFLIDMFDANELKTENLIRKIGRIIENLEYYRKIIEVSVKRALPTIERPIEHLAKLLT